MDKKLNDLIPSILELLLPEGTDKEITLDGTKVKVTKKDGKFELEVKDEKFDDEDIKEEIADFKRAIKELDDDIFIDFIEHIGNTIKLNEFSHLLDLPHFCEKDAETASNLMTMFNDIFEGFMDDHIKWLIDQKNRYLNIIG